MDESEELAAVYLTMLKEIEGAANFFYFFL
jgi:hypothetical protein